MWARTLGASPVHPTTHRRMALLRTVTEYVGCGRVATPGPPKRWKGETCGSPAARAAADPRRWYGMVWRGCGSAPGLLAACAARHGTERHASCVGSAGTERPSCESSVGCLQYIHFAKRDESPDSSALLIGERRGCVFE